MTKSPSCLLNTSCSLNYFGRISPPVRLLHPVLLIDTKEYLMKLSHLKERTKHLTKFGPSKIYNWKSWEQENLLLRFLTFSKTQVSELVKRWKQGQLSKIQMHWPTSLEIVMQLFQWRKIQTLFSIYHRISYSLLYTKVLWGKFLKTITYSNGAPFKFLSTIIILTQ